MEGVLEEPEHHITNPLGLLHYLRELALAQLLVLGEDFDKRGDEVWVVRLGADIDNPGKEPVRQADFN